jgi:hypothetical protein
MKHTSEFHKFYPYLHEDGSILFAGASVKNMGPSHMLHKANTRIPSTEYYIVIQNYCRVFRGLSFSNRKKIKKSDYGI